MKNIKSLICFVLVVSFAAGMAAGPIFADNGFISQDILDLLEERQEYDVGAVEVKEKKTAADFTDVTSEDWFYPYLDYLVSEGTINGKTEDTFEPYSTFSYAECSAVIVRYLGLEKEAEKRKNEIVSRCPELINQWFVGYFDVLSELGVFNDYGLFEKSDGNIVAVNKELANSPIVRYRFAESISKSFEIESHLKAKNVYPEIGGCGREFIIGGGYKAGILSKYEKLICDYEEIPEQSRLNVIKAYYNGIFNGDITGNFYPHKNLTRGEMAKVLATVCDYSLRTRLIEDGYGLNVTEDMLHTDAFGVKTLKYEVWTGILTNCVENLVCQNGSVSYINNGNAPEGYAVDVYLYDKTENGCLLLTQSTLHANGNGFSHFATNAKVLFVMRNTANKGLVEGVVSVEIADGTVTEIKPNICILQ